MRGTEAACSTASDGLLHRAAALLRPGVALARGDLYIGRTIQDPALDIPSTDPAPSAAASTPVSSPAPVPAPARTNRLNPRWAHAIPVLLILMFLVAITQPGLAYRRWVWDFTEPGRFRGDISRNFMFGVQAIEGGFLNLYENQVRDNPSRDKKIDYPPLRLATFEAWAAWNRRAEPGVQKWRDDYAFSAPLMRYYAALQWAAALAALLIVRHWLRRCAAGGADEDAGPLAVGSLRLREALTPWTGLWRSLLAFTILWFDPGVAIIAHGWPSPNMWVIPF